MIAALLIGGAALAHAAWNIAMKRAGTSGTPFIAASGIALDVSPI